MERQLWERQEGESSKAHAAFLVFLRLPIEQRSIDAAWRRASGLQETSNHANGVWTGWSSKYNWVARATAHDTYLAKKEQDEYDALWEERRRIARQRDFEQADKIRAIIDESLPHAERFIKSSRSFIQGKDGAPDKEIITLSFDLTGLSRVLTDVSKLQRLANDQSTENIGLSGAALDAAILRELAKLANSGQAAIAEISSAADATAGSRDELDGTG